MTTNKTTQISNKQITKTNINSSADKIKIKIPDYYEKFVHGYLTQEIKKLKNTTSNNK